MSDEFRQIQVANIVTFLRDIGISVAVGNVDDDAFLPGIEVVGGGIVVDESKLKYPGDLLHEAGHLAVVRVADRHDLNGKVESPDSNPQVVEVEAMLWSYAACINLGIPPQVVFHRHGYHGRSEDLLRNFELGVFLGVQGLEAYGMTLSPARAESIGVQPFPKMQKWLRN